MRGIDVIDTKEATALPSIRDRSHDSPSFPIGAQNSCYAIEAAERFMIEQIAHIQRQTIPAPGVINHGVTHHQTWDLEGIPHIGIRVPDIPSSASNAKPP